MCSACERRIAQMCASGVAVSATWECPTCGQQSFRKGQDVNWGEIAPFVVMLGAFIVVLAIAAGLVAVFGPK